MTKKRHILRAFCLLATFAALSTSRLAAAPGATKLSAAPGGTASPASSATTADPLAAGIQKYKQGKYAEAIQFLSNFVGKNAGSPSAATAYYYMGCCYYQAGRTEDAKRIYETVTRSFPRAPEAQMSAGMLSRLAAATPAGSGVFPANAAAAASAAALGPVKPVPPPGAGKNAPPTAPAAAGGSSSDDGDDGNSPRYEAEYASLPQSTRVLFKRDDGGHMYVTVWLNNHPIKAIFDTGAHAHFGLNHLSQVGVSVPANAQTSYTSGWAGKPVPIWVMDADLKMGEMKRRVPITVEENMSLAPLVGQEFLKEMRYEIDDKGGVMTLTKTRNSKTAKEFNSMYDVPCMHVNGDDMIPVEIQGKKTAAIIDTGAQVTIFSPSTLKQLGIEIPSDAQVTSIGGVGGSLRCWVVELDLQVGPIRKQNFRTLVGGNAGNAIGQDFLEGWRYTVDQDRHLMRFFH